MSDKVFITAAGKYLPGEPIANNEMEDYLGLINHKSSRTREKMLEQNGIRTRHYAIDKNQKTLISNSEMVSNAVKDCLTHSGINKSEIDFIAAATTQGDIPIPGFASMVHAELGTGPCEIATLHGVCGSSMMAIKNAYLQVKAEGKQNAVACAGELPSRMFKAQHYEKQTSQIDGKDISLETDFLRWMLSDGAGAVLLQPKPHPKKLSMQIEWIEIKSFAPLFDVCMYTGANKDKQGRLGKSWLDYSNFQEADTDGAINLKQDIKLVNNIITLGVDGFFELIDKGKIKSDEIDYLVCHYSSHYFKGKIVELMAKAGVSIPEEKWFTNLYTKGNTGSASIFIMLEELMNEGKLKPGEKILCMVPESGRFLTAFMYLTVVGPTDNFTKNFIPEKREIKPPAITTTGTEIQQWLVRQLTQVWIDFENKLNNVPIVDKINRGTLTIEEYRDLIYNLRQQVIDGSQWIARAASNVSMDFFDARSAFISHARDEHRDYQMLEKNYVSVGGQLDVILKGQKNVGSEALSAFMFQRASLPNPFDLLGGMFIIEGLGNRMAGYWGKAIRDQLNLTNEQVSFLIYHESSDSNENHFERFEKAIQSELLTINVAERIVKTAKVTARLYLLQLQEIGNF
jgi:3-oxoacyl-[acyl-carrier-protein] synthase III